MGGSSSSSDSSSSSSSDEGHNRHSRMKKDKKKKKNKNFFLQWLSFRDQTSRESEQPSQSDGPTTIPTINATISCDIKLEIVKVKEDTLIVKQEQQISSDKPTESTSTPITIYYEIDRFCPHKQADLSVRSIMEAPNYITCLKHKYKFDLESGRCVSNDKGCQLRSRRVLDW